MTCKQRTVSLAKLCDNYTFAHCAKLLIIIIIIIIIINCNRDSNKYSWEMNIYNTYRWVLQQIGDSVRMILFAGRSSTCNLSRCPQHRKRSCLCTKTRIFHNCSTAFLNFLVLDLRYRHTCQLPQVAEVIYLSKDQAFPFMCSLLNNTDFNSIQIIASVISLILLW